MENSKVTPFDVSKPVLVFLFGVIPVKPLEAKLDDWSSLFNVLVFEPVTDHFDRLFKDTDFEEVIILYNLIMRKMVPDKTGILGFMGFSYGGEMAIRMAQEYWKSKKKYCPFIILGDSFLGSSEALTKLEDEQIKNMKITDELVLSQIRITSALNSDREKYDYDGPAVYLNAMRPEVENSSSEEDIYKVKLEGVRKHLKNVHIIDFPEHTGESFIVLIDEWDCIFREDKNNKELQANCRCYRIWQAFLQACCGFVYKFLS